MNSIINILTSTNPNLFFTRLALILGIILAVIILYKISEPPFKKIENFTQKEPFVLKTNQNIYDDFYVDIYDELYDTKKRIQRELTQVLKLTEPTVKNSCFLDIGSGTGYLVDQLTKAGYIAYGIDKSFDMIKYSENKYPESEYKCGDVIVDPMLYENSTFTHILCTNLTVYLFEDKMTFFRNCYFWLKPNGYLILHLANRHKFSIYKPVSKKPLFKLPMKKYPPRITDTIVEFDDFKYTSLYQFPKNNNDKSIEQVIFKEKFIDKETKNVREHEQTMYMESISTILKMASKAGFIVKGKVDMTTVNKKGPYADRFQFLYILERVM
jgi:SAM-dependent methyltransferase